MGLKIRAGNMRDRTGKSEKSGEEREYDMLGLDMVGLDTCKFRIGAKVPESAPCRTTCLCFLPSHAHASTHAHTHTYTETDTDTDTDMDMDTDTDMHTYAHGHTHIDTSNLGTYIELEVSRRLWASLGRIVFAGSRHRFAELPVDCNATTLDLHQARITVVSSKRRRV